MASSLKPLSIFHEHSFDSTQEIDQLPSLPFSKINFDPCGTMIDRKAMVFLIIFSKGLEI
jgi:hypothetical protein